MLKLAHKFFSHLRRDHFLHSLFIISTMTVWRLTRGGTKKLAYVDSWSSTTHTSRVLRSSNCSSKYVMTTFWNKSSLGGLLNQRILQCNKKNKKKIQYKTWTSYLDKNCILQFSQRFLVQIQKCSCPMSVNGLTSTFDDVMVVKEAQYLHPQKVGPIFFLFCHYLLFKFSIPTMR